MLLFCTFWAPYAIIAMIGLVGDQSVLTPSATFFPVMFAKLSSVHGPIIHAITNKRFRRAVRDLVVSIKFWRSSNWVTSQSQPSQAAANHLPRVVLDDDADAIRMPCLRHEKVNSNTPAEVEVHAGGHSWGSTGPQHQSVIASSRRNTGSRPKQRFAEMSEVATWTVTAV